MSLRKKQLWPPGSIISDLVWASSSPFRPPVTNKAANYSVQHGSDCAINMEYGKDKRYTWLVWNLLITIGIQSSSSNILDPVLDLGDPCIDAMAWTLTTIANHTNLGQSKNIPCCKVWIPSLVIFIYLPFSSVTINGPPESPWQESFSFASSPAQI